MQIKKKLLVEVITLSVILSAVSSITVNNTLMIENNFSSLNNEMIPILTNLKDMRLIATNMLSSTLEYAVILQNDATPTDHSDMSQELGRIETDINDEKNQFKEILSVYKSRLADQDDLALADEIERRWDQLEAVSEKFIEYRKKGIADDTLIKLNEEFANSKESLFVKIDSAIIINEKKVDEKREMVSVAVANTTIVVFVNLFVFVLLVVALRYYILRSMLHTISRLRTATKEIAAGNLQIQVKTIPKDEVGELLVDVERMAHDLDRAQKKLVESEKFSVIGELAARMAHDIRNPLTSIKIGIEYFMKKANWNESDLRMFGTVDGAIDRISFQIQDVLDFIKTTPIAPESTSLLTLLQHVTASQKFPDGIKVVLPDTDVVIDCDPRKMQVVFINLLRNALDAAKPEGTISVRFTDLDDRVKIEVEDTGSGIPPQNHSKVFEPLFTTKQRGTGLGLSSVKNIVEQHGGQIAFSNNPTVFTIMMPKSQAAEKHT